MYKRQAGVLPEVQNHADFLIVHDYFTFSPNENNISYSQMMASVSEVSEDAASVRSMVSQYTSKDPDHFALAFTEFNSNTGNREVAMANASSSHVCCFPKLKKASICR